MNAESLLASADAANVSVIVVSYKTAHLLGRMFAALEMLPRAVDDFN